MISAIVQWRDCSRRRMTMTESELVEKLRAMRNMAGNVVDAM